MSLSKLLAVLALACSTALGGQPSCTTKAVAVQSVVQVANGKVLVPATVGGHTNILVAVPEAVAFSQVAVPIGVPVASYSAVSYGQQFAPAPYQPTPAGQGLAHPAGCRCETNGAVQTQAVDDVTAQVTELFKTSCVSCHSSEKHSGGFRMFDESGTLLKLPRHTILERVLTDDETLRMPKGGHALSDEQKALVAKWSKLPKETVW